MKYTMPELLFEIGTEELPPSLINNLTNQIKENIIKGLAENHISVNLETIKTFNTPRRIAIYIAHLPQKQKEEEIEARGPDKEKAFDKSGNATQAAIGFAKKYNLDPKNLIVKKINAVEYVFAKTKIGGLETKTVLANILSTSLKQTTGDKFMRWGSYNEKFARPILWILAILDTDVINFIFNGIKSNRFSYGHRFLSNKKIEIKSPKNYEEELLKHKVIASNSNRITKIIEQVKTEAQKINGNPILNEDLIQQVANITEYPGSLLCNFDKEFLSLPPTVVETVLERHQRYFVLKKQDKEELLPHFIVITNGTEISNKITQEQIKKGNEKVARARLNDAKFFFEEDLKIPFTFETRGKQLSNITFQKGLGSMEEKVERLIKLSEFIYENISKQEVRPEDIINTAKLCKLDLSTHMMFELPELQGEIGAIYAQANNFNESICKGIAEHYSQCPKSLAGKIISIADKFDNIICLFSIGKIPTGSADPFAIRRQSQGIIDTILSGNSVNINLSDLISYFKNHVSNEALKTKLTLEKENLIRSLLIDRFINHIDISLGIDQDLIHAACSVGDPLTNLFDTKEKIKLLDEHFAKEKIKFKPFLVAAKRLVRIVEPNINGNVEIKDLTTPHEIELFKRFEELRIRQHKSYKEFLTDLSTLTDPINNFFEKVLVNDPDPKIKQARHALLKKGKDLFEKICDFNQIQERN